MHEKNVHIRTHMRMAERVRDRERECVRKRECDINESEVKGLRIDTYSRVLLED